MINFLEMLFSMNVYCGMIKYYQYCQCLQRHQYLKYYQSQYSQHGMFSVREANRLRRSSNAMVHNYLTILPHCLIAPEKLHNLKIKTQ